MKGPGVMVCYYHNPEATAEVLKDGWLHTGDMAKQDEDGFYFLVDRKKDVIISGGENLYPVQIEDFLAAYPKVHDVAVIGPARQAVGGDRRRHHPDQRGHDLHRERDQPVLH